MAADDNEAMHPDDPTTPLPHGTLRLADWGVIRASGADARKFLNGQLTQQTLQWSAGQARLAGYCSAKGRLLASFVLWAGTDDTVMLACSADLLPATLKRLSMFVLRAQCKLIDASAEVPLWGVAGALPDGAPAMAVWQHAAWQSAEMIRLPDAIANGRTQQRHLWAGSAAGSAPALPPIDADAWRWLEVTSGVPRVVAATADQFVPQMINFELVGGVDFQKGCYPGQEVVARSQYRGSVKRRAQLLHSATPLQPGAEVFSSADPEQPAGMVVLGGSWNGAPAALTQYSSHLALVQLKTAALTAGTLHAGSANGPLLTPAPLPYAIPAGAD